MLATLFTVALLHWVALITPGANVLLVSQLAASGHRESACYASIGISVVAVIWALLVILGVNAIFAAHPALRLSLKIAGGVYLCYFGFRLWRAGVAVGARQSAPFAPWAAFRMGFFTNITNAKTALFFGGVFSTALPAEPGTVLLAAAIALVFANALVCHFMLAFAFSRPSIQAGYDRQRRLLNRIAAGIVGAYGLRLLATVADELIA